MNLHIDIAPSFRPRLRCVLALAWVVAGTLAWTDPLRAVEPPAPPNPGPGQVNADANAEYDKWSALQIMRETQQRHEQFPYVYEEQTMVLMDGQGHRSVRLCRRFSRTEDDGSAKFLLVFDDPEEIRGVVLLAVRDADGQTTRGVYLPAFGNEFKQPAPGTRSEHFLGTDFSVEDLTIESLDEHRYVRERDRIREDVEFFVVDAYPANAQIERSSGYGLRRHEIRKDNFMIVQTDFFDRHLRFMKQISYHDLHPVSGDSWRANMIVATNAREKHRTLLKIDRRIYSRDYVPKEIFEQAFLLENRHVLALDLRVRGRLALPSPLEIPSPGSGPGSAPSPGAGPGDTNTRSNDRTGARMNDSRNTQERKEPRDSLDNRSIVSDNGKERRE